MMKSINVLGYGLMGKQIVSLFYLLGYHVNVWSTTTPNLSLLSTIIDKHKSIFSEGVGEIVVFQNIDNLPNNITIEALVEDLDIKKNIFVELKKHISKSLFTNSSSFTPSEISSGIGLLHFFNPIKMKLVEYIPVSQDIEESQIIEDLRLNGFLIMPVQNNRCFLGNFILFHEFSTFFKLVEKYNYSYNNIEHMINKLYGQRDLLKIIDIIGVDVVNKIMQNIREVEDEFYVSKLLIKAECNAILGYKNNTSIKNFLNKIC